MFKALFTELKEITVQILFRLELLHFQFAGVVVALTKPMIPPNSTNTLWRLSIVSLSQNFYFAILWKSSFPDPQGWRNHCLFARRNDNHAFKVPVTLIFFFFFDEKLSHPWIQIKKKTFKFLRLSMGFDRRKIKIWVLTEQIEDWYLWRSTSNLRTACTAFINRKQTRFEL